MKTRSLIPIAALFLASMARGEIQPSPLFSDHAVFQQSVPVPVWGRATPGSPVEVRIQGQVKTAKTGPDGEWKITLDPLKPGSALEMIVTGVGEGGDGTKTIRDILVGEVWFAAGQSNMEMPFNSCENAAEERAKVNAPEIRFFKVDRRTSEQTLTTLSGRWLKMAPGTVGGMSGAAYYFAHEIQTHTGHPVGIIQSAWGGSPVEAWMSPRALDTPSFSATHESYRRRLEKLPQEQAAYTERLAAWEADKAAAPDGKPANRRPEAPYGPGSARWPSGLYNGMVHPVIPYAIRGVLWYQGEANSATHQTYRGLFTALIADWRERWGLGEIPFFYVQLPNWIQGGANPQLLWAHLREAQEAALTLPNTGMIVTLDIGDPHDVHPKNKREVGRRLSLLARARVYGQSVPCDSPKVTSCRLEGGAAVLEFAHAKELRYLDSNATSAFELAGKDGVYYPAVSNITGSRVVVTSPQVPQPLAVRYAWDNNPRALLVNEHDLPAAPYRSIAQ